MESKMDMENLLITKENKEKVYGRMA